MVEKYMQKHFSFVCIIVCRMARRKVNLKNNVEHIDFRPNYSESIDETKCFFLQKCVFYFDKCLPVIVLLQRLISIDTNEITIFLQDNPNFSTFIFLFIWPP